MKNPTTFESWIEVKYFGLTFAVGANVTPAREGVPLKFEVFSVEHEGIEIIHLCDAFEVLNEIADKAKQKFR